MNELANDEQQSADSCSRSACGACARWRLPLLLAVVLAAIVALNSRGIRVGNVAPEAKDGAPAVGEESKHNVSLTIDYGKGRRVSFPQLPWYDGMTVADLLAAVRRESQADSIDYVVQGSGASALLTAIGKTTNEGGGGANWTYTVNGQRADRSFAIYDLEPNDQVLWSYSPSE